MAIRHPSVAGKFYPKDAERLLALVEECSGKGARREPAIGAMSPHAGLIYSGRVAGKVYAGIEPPESIVLLGPNHTGLGARFAIMPEGEWEIPFARLAIDSALASGIMERTPLMEADTEAHYYEHSLEVQLPFIAYHFPQARIVPIAIMAAAEAELAEVGAAIADAVRLSGMRALVLASSDMSHFLPESEAIRLDQLALEHVLSLDPDGLCRSVRRLEISMCGYLPAAAMLHAAKALGAKEATLVAYATSGEVSGDFESVVGYAGVVVR